MIIATFSVSEFLPKQLPWSDKYRALHKSRYLMIIERYFFSFLIETITSYDPSSETSRWDSADEGPQCMFVLTPHLKCLRDSLDEESQNMFYAEVTKIILIWLKYCWKGSKIASHPSIHLNALVKFEDLYILARWDLYMYGLMFYTPVSVSYLF